MELGLHIADFTWTGGAPALGPALARHVREAEAAGVEDQGQISKLLSRLERLDLIENVDHAQSKGAPNEWCLTERGERVERATRPM